jgi:hypothetical protein
MPNGDVVEVESKSYNATSNGTTILFKGVGQSEGGVAIVPKDALVIL